MKNVCIKMIILFLIIGLILSNNCVMAATTSSSGGGAAPQPTLGLGDLDQYAGDGGSSASFDEKVNKVISVIQVIASVVSVAVLIVLGIKYMMGSVEAKAEYKRTMIPYLVGAFLVFGITNITSLLYYIAKHMI